MVVQVNQHVFDSHIFFFDNQTLVRDGLLAAERFVGRRVDVFQLFKIAFQFESDFQVSGLVLCHGGNAATQNEHGSTKEGSQIQGGSPKERLQVFLNVSFF